MKNFVQPGEVVTLTAPYDVASGAGLLVGVLFGVAAYAASSGDPVEAKRVGVYDLPKPGSQAWTEGAPVYWDDTEKRATSVAADGVPIGAAAEEVGNGAGETTGRVILIPTIPAEEGSA